MTQIYTYIYIYVASVIPYFTMEKMGQIPEHHWLKWPTMPLYSLQSRWRKVCKHSSCHTGFPRCFDISLLKRDKVPTDCYPLKYVNVLPVFLSFAYFFFFLLRSSPCWSKIWSCEDPRLSIWHISSPGLSPELQGRTRKFPQWT